MGKEGKSVTLAAYHTGGSRQPFVFLR